MDYSAFIAILDSIECPYSLSEPMSLHTSFQIGGPADIFITPPSKEVLTRILPELQKFEIPCLIIGNGSNLLVNDTGIRGAVIHISNGFSEIELRGATEIYCGAGIKLSKLCNFALENSLCGIEGLWGIPGLAGGAAYMNAGAYDAEMKQVLLSCDHLTLKGEEGRLSGDEMDLGYRRSAYMENGCIITGLHLRLTPGDTGSIREKMRMFMERRKDKQPLEFPSAGSIFKRPKNNFAGTLIEKCGLKGARVGGAQVSEKHAGFIINTGGAVCSDVLSLIEKIQETVFLETDVKLECEVKLI